MIIEAATGVFLRYGFRRTTMGDIASAAGISRPALYLRFCNKENIFETVLGAFTARMLDEIRAGLAAPRPALTQLRFAFECWAIRPFSLAQGSPGAYDLASGDQGFAERVRIQSHLEFEAILVPILRTVPAFGDREDAALGALAHMLTAAAQGLKDAAEDAGDLGAMIDLLLEVTVNQAIQAL